jgi:hypothetical protein
MTNPLFYLENHLPDGDVPFYEYHTTKPEFTLDYHQGYRDGNFTGSSLLTPEHREWVEKAAALAEEFNPQRRLFFVEWDHPGERTEVPTPGVFILLDPFDRGRAQAGDTPYETPRPGAGWEDFLLRLADAAGYKLTEEDLPEFPEVGTYITRYLIGLFPDRITDTVWFRFVCNTSINDAREIAKHLKLDQRWFDKIDLEANVNSCLVSFDLYPDGWIKPCAEMILRREIPATMPEFVPIEKEMREIIMEHHGERLKELHISHFKVPLTEEGWDSGLVKFYMIGSTVEGYNASPAEG